MCKFANSICSSWRIGFLAVLAAVVCAARPALAHQNPPGCQINQVPLGISNIPATTVTDGAVITYTVNFTLPPPAPGGVCQITGVDSDLTLPNGTVIPILRNATIDPGDNFVCPSADVRCVTAGPYTYTVAHADETGPRTGCPPGPPGSGLARVTAFATSVGDAHNFGTDPAFDHLDNNQGCVLAINQVRHPRLRVTKQCVNGNCEDGVITFNGTVTNIGDEALVAVTVVDDRAGPVLGPTTLAVGESKTFSGSYVATTTPSSNTVTATGTGVETGVSTSATATATCELRQNPCIRVSKVCENATTPGGPIAVSGVVTNCGDVSLHITSIVDSKGAVLTGCGPSITLAPGGTCTYSGSYTPTECPSTDTVTVNAVVTGAAASRCGATPVSDSSDPQTCTAPGNPSIRVTKVCQNGTDPDNPVITFNGTVCNNGDVPLEGVTVTDDKAGPVLGPISLNPGQCATYSGSYTPTECPSTDTVTAVGTSTLPPACGGGTVTNTASATCRVDSRPDISVTKECELVEGVVLFHGTVCNTGNVTLHDVTVVDDKGGPVLGPISLNPGQCVTYSGSYTPTEAGPTFTDTVTASGFDDSRGTCKIGCHRIVDGRCQVLREAECTTERPVTGCRVTGGGHLLAREQSPAPCVPEPVPRRVTHGGQVGAPYSVATPFDPDSECIRGQWQHVRHIKGGLRGVFHARSFDSLLCACLGCPENPDAPIVEGGLCNPGDRICGPEPRRAGANKICFSGVGDYVLTRGRKEPRSVVFRVDIEDRSEPGGTHKNPPPDRYRIRIWILSADCGKAFSADSTQGLDLRRAVACTSASEDLPGTVPPPDIDDGGDLIRGNHQIHPPTGAVCR